MKVSRITPARTGDTFAKHSENLVEVRACKIAIRIGTAHSLEQFRFIPVFRSAHSTTWCARKSKGASGMGMRAELALPIGAPSCTQSNNSAPVVGKDRTLGNASPPV